MWNSETTMLPDEDDVWRMPDVVPDWVLLAEQPLQDLPSGDCGCGLPDEEPAGPEVGWSIPGVTGLAMSPELPAVSPAVGALQRAVARVCAADPAGLPAAQALVDSEALLAVEQQLRVHGVRRIADVGARGLHELVGFRSARTWLRARRPDGDTGDAPLGLALREFPVLQAAVESGECALGAARKTVHALRRCARHVDRPDGLIDGQPAEQVIPAVVRNVVTLAARYLLGFGDDDPRLVSLTAQSEQVLAAGGTELQQLEGAFTMLAREVPVRALTAHLEELVLAVLPSELEDRADRGHDQRGVSLTRKDDGSGWCVVGDLDLECGERLFTALTAEASRDPRNPADTQGWADARGQQGAGGGEQSGGGPLGAGPGLLGEDLWGLGADLFAGLDPTERPRSKRRRMHDALNRLLERYLEHGLGGVAGKVPVQVNVTLPAAAVTGDPGAAPARGDSGALLPRSLVRRWWCDSNVTAFVLSLGGKALRAVHAQRTLTGLERRALAIESGGTCAGMGCCRGAPDPLVVIRPHHARRFADDGVTTIEETVPVCDVLHHDLHEGQRTVLLRDGRYLSEHGFVDRPTLFDPPPF